MRVLCVGSAVMDIIGYPIGQADMWKEKQRISSIQIMPGGDAVNQSVYLASLGTKPALAACVGQDMNGEILKSTLQGFGVDISLVKAKENCATGTAMVLVDTEGERRIFSVKGAHSTLSREDVPWKLSEECRAISLASLFSMPEFEQDGLLEYLKEMRLGGKLIFADLAADKLGQGLEGIRRFLPYLDYFLPSVYDVLKMTGAKTAEEAARFFYDEGVKHVVIKCGDKGCYCYSDVCEGWIPAVPVKVVDTTGAGDCMTAVFISRILAGDRLDEACRYACAAASYSTTFTGACTAKLEDSVIRQMLKQNVSKI